MVGYKVEHGLIWLPKLSERVVKDIEEEDRIIRIVEYSTTYKQVRYVFMDKNNLDEEEAIKNKMFGIYHAKFNLPESQILINNKGKL